jgi:hypothetical protein
MAAKKKARRGSKPVTKRFGKGKKGAALSCKLRRNKKGVVIGAECTAPAKVVCKVVGKRRKGKGKLRGAAEKAEAARWANMSGLHRRKGRKSRR